MVVFNCHKIKFCGCQNRHNSLCISEVESDSIMVTTHKVVFKHPNTIEILRKYTYFFSHYLSYTTFINHLPSFRFSHLPFHGFTTHSPSYEKMNLVYWEKEVQQHKK